MTNTNAIRDLYDRYNDQDNKLVFEKNVSVPLRASHLPIRCNVYRPLDSDSEKYPVLMTYGPYGKDIPYQTYAFHTESLQKCV